MGRVNEIAQADDVVAVRMRIDSWRETRVAGRPMPEELWAAAVSLAAVHRPYAVARALRVDYGALKGRLAEPQPAAASEAPAVADFVEVDAGRVVEDDHPSVRELELTAPDGSAMVVRLADGATVDVQGLAEAFWRRSA